MNILKRLITVLCAFSLIVSAIIQTAAQSSGNERAQERALKVGVYPFEGYFDTDNGKHSGFGIEYLNEMAKYTGFTYEFVDGSFHELLTKLYTNEIDLLGGVFETNQAPYDLAYADYRSGYTRGYLTCLSDNSELKRDDYSTFDGITIGVVKDYIINPTFVKFAAEKGFTFTEKNYESDKLLYEALKTGEVDAVIATDSVISDFERIIAFFHQVDIYFTTNSENTELLNEINYALAQININTPSFEGEMLKKYFNDSSLTSENELEFTERELEYIKHSEVIRVYNTPLPFHNFNLDDEQRMLTDRQLLDLISGKTGLHFEIYPDGTLVDAVKSMETGAIDIIMNLTDPEGVGLLTVPYFKSGSRLVRNKSVSHVTDFILPSFFENESYVYDHFAGCTIRYADNYSQCVDEINSGKAHATIISDVLYEPLALLHEYENLEFSSVDDLTIEVGMSVSRYRDPVLIDILNKAITSLNGEEINTIVSKIQMEIVNNARLATQNNDLMLIIILVVSTIAVLSLFAVLIVREKRIYKKRADKIENTDMLTGERNIDCFYKDADSLVNKKGLESFSVMQINIRNFKYINDVYSTSEGDRLLRFLAKSIKSLLTQNEIQARMNADNFVVLLMRNEMSQILSFFNELKLAISRDRGFSIEDIMGEIYCGFYIFSADNDIKQGVQNAHIALRFAADNKLSHIMYDDGMRVRLMREAEIIKSMYDAMRDEEFCFYLQPQHYLDHNDMVLSAEALVRWIKPDGSVVYPNDFIPIFERNGFVVELDRYIFEQVCRYISYTTDDIGEIRIAVNVSKLDLYKRDFVEFYTSVKSKYGIADGMLELEFTESVAFENYETFNRVVHQLKENGFCCSLDDFGSGSSSLNTLKELSVDTLKMDRMFFIGYNEDEKRSKSLIASVVAMAHGLDMEIVAEGVEDEEQLYFLRGIGCDIVQGYVYSKPLPVKEFHEYVLRYKNNRGIKVRTGLSLPEKIGIDVIYSKYISALKHTDSMVWEIDLESDAMSVVSTAGGQYHYLSTSGVYSKEIENFINNQITPSEQMNLKKITSIHYLISCFVRGDESITHEFYGKVYDANLQCFKEEYEKFTITFCRTETGNNNYKYLNAYIRKYSKEDAMPDDKLALAVKALQGTIYEINIKTNKVSVIQNNYGENGVIKSGNLNEQLQLFLDKNIHPEDIDIVRRAVSFYGLEKFKKSGSDIQSYRYRKKDETGKYVWRMATVIKNKDNTDVFIVFIQGVEGKEEVKYEDIIS